MTGGGSLDYGRYDLDALGPEPLLRLYGKVYGDAQPLRDRWRWELSAGPKGEDAIVYAAWDGGELVAMTVRFPCRLIVSGEEVRAFFAAHTMVDPSHRGRGVVRDLYTVAASGAPLQLSKGTAPGMYQVLLKMGYRPVLPGNYQVCLLAPFAWLAGKLSGRGSVREMAPPPTREWGEFVPVTRFSAEHEPLVAAALTAPTGGTDKSVAYLNWRYVDIPHRSYHRFVRRVGEEVVSLVVIGLAGATAYLVDLRWSAAGDEPDASIRFAKRFARHLGAVKMVSWGTLRSFREALGSQLFVNRSDTPRFSYFPVDARYQNLDWSKIHLVHGDGDTEYL